MSRGINWEQLTRRVRDYYVAKEVMGIDTDDPPPYTADINIAASLVEDEIERRGKVEAYVDALIYITSTQVDAVPFNPDNEYSSFEMYIPVKAVWALLRATPEQRCLAALRAVGVDV